MVLTNCLFVKLKHRNKKYIIEYREWLTYEYVTTKIDGIHYLTKQLIDTPHWSEWKECWTGKNPARCRKIINDFNKKWAGLKQYRLK